MNNNNDKNFSNRNTSNTSYNTNMPTQANVPVIANNSNVPPQDNDINNLKKVILDKSNIYNQHPVNNTKTRQVKYNESVLTKPDKNSNKIIISIIILLIILLLVGIIGYTVTLSNKIASQAKTDDNSIGVDIGKAVSDFFNNIFSEEDEIISGNIPAAAGTERSLDSFDGNSKITFCDPDGYILDEEESIGNYYSYTTENDQSILNIGFIYGTSLSQYERYKEFYEDYTTTSFNSHLGNVNIIQTESSFTNYIAFVDITDHTSVIITVIADGNMENTKALYDIQSVINSITINK